MTHPPARTLTVLVAGHATVLVGAVLLAGLLMIDGSTPAADDPSPSGRVTDALSVSLICASLGAVAVGQILSVRRLTRHSRAAGAGRLDEPALAAGIRGLTWPVVLAFYPIILGMGHLLLDPPPPALLAALVAVIAASLLLDLQHAAWIYRRLPHTRGTRALPPGSHSHIRGNQRVAAVLYGGCALGGIILLVATVLGEIQRPVPEPLAAAVQIAAAAGGVLVPLLLVHPLRQVSAAITTTDHGVDVVHLDTLDRAAHPFVRLPPLFALAAALAAAALVATPAAPEIAAFRALLLLLVLGAAVRQLGALTSINLADIVRPTRTRR